MEIFKFYPFNFVCQRTFCYFKKNKLKIFCLFYPRLGSSLDLCILTIPKPFICMGYFLFLFLSTAISGQQWLLVWKNREQFLDWFCLVTQSGSSGSFQGAKCNSYVLIWWLSARSWMKEAAAVWGLHAFRKVLFP